ACRVRDDRLLARLLLPLRVDGIERILEARGREHDNVAALRLRRRLLRCAPSERHQHDQARHSPKQPASHEIHLDSPRSACTTPIDTNTLRRYIPTNIAGAGRPGDGKACLAASEDCWPRYLHPDAGAWCCRRFGRRIIERWPRPPVIAPECVGEY